MEIKIRLFATLREGRGKEVFLDFPKGTVVNEIIKKLEIVEEDVAILLINGLDGKLTDEVEENDVVSIFPPVGGG